MEKPVVVVTGFGPFRRHVTNDSWTVAQTIHESGFGDELGVQLTAKQLPVCYDSSDKTVPEIWSLNPMFVLHIGIHPKLDSVIRLEAKSAKSTYVEADVDGKSPVDGLCCMGTEDTLCTGLNLNEMVESLVAQGIQADLSNDPGKYLCGYTYYLSLCHDSNRTLFVHIPPSDSEMPLQSKIEAIKLIIRNAVNQLKNK